MNGHKVPGFLQPPKFVCRPNVAGQLCWPPSRLGLLSKAFFPVDSLRQFLTLYGGKCEFGATLQGISDPFLLSIMGTCKIYAYPSTYLLFSRITHAHKTFIYIHIRNIQLYGKWPEFRLSPANIRQTNPCVTQKYTHGIALIFTSKW